MMPRSNKLRLQSNIWKFYLFNSFGAALGLVIPVIVLFWQDNGLNLTEIMILQSLFSIILIIFEIPSGYLADIWGRKKTFVWGAALLLLSIIAYSFSSSFITFLFAESLIAVGMSLLSGADSAFLYDTLKQLGREKEYKKVWGKKVFYAISTMALLNLLGGYIGSFDTRYTWYAAILPMLLMFLISFSFYEPKRSKLIYEKGYIHELLKIVKDKVVAIPKLKWLIVYTGLAFSFFHSAFWFYQPLFEITGVKVVYYGAIFAGFNVFTALVSKNAHKIEEAFGKKLTLSLITIVSGFALLLMGKILFLFSFLFMFLQQFVRGIYNVVVSDYINQLTTSSVRATVLSAQNFFARLLYALILPVLGYMADLYTVPQTLSIMGVTVLVAGSVLLLFLHRYRLV
jgi:MFS family permease